MDSYKNGLPFPARNSPAWKFRLPGMRNPLLFQKAEISAAISDEFDVLILVGDFHRISSWVAGILARLRGKKVIYWSHGISKGKRFRRIKWQFRKNLIRLANAVLLYGEREYNEYVKRGVKMDKVFMARNALDTRLSRAIRKAITQRDLEQFKEDKSLRSQHVLIYSGRLLAYKRVNEIISAMPTIRQHVPDAILVIIGDGPEAPKLKSQIEQLGLSSVVQMPGAIFDEETLARYYLSADLAVCPGKVGLMVNHAFVYGVPVVTSDKPWYHGPEVAMIQNGVTGMFFRHGDIDSLAKCVVGLLKDKSKLADMRKACMKLIDDVYNERTMAMAFDKAVEYALK